MTRDNENTRDQKPNIPALPAWALPIARFEPGDAREAAEQRSMLDLIAREGDFLLTRENTVAHMTASAIIVSPDRRRTLMAFHRIYGSWAWTGGHADGETDFEALARREASEETGITGLKRLGTGIVSVEILPVWAHVRRGQSVGTHLHLNVSYLFEADDSLPLRVAEAENSAVGWLDVARLGEAVSEQTMIQIYERLLRRANDC